MNPFFILSNPRSGSSLLRIILESHPNITVPPECGFLQWWFSKYKSWSIKDSRNSSKIEEFIKDLKSSRKIETYDFNFDIYKKRIQELLPTSYSDLMALVYICYGLKHKQNLMFWGDKNNYYIHATELLHSLYPRAKYIHLIRDGRDVAVSYLKLKTLKTNSPYKPKLPEDIVDIALEWHSNNQMLTEFTKSVGNENILRVYYEDLILDLEEECRKITLFLGVNFDKQMLKYFEINKSNNLEPLETLDWKKKTLKPPDKENIGKYRTFLSDSQIDAFTEIAKQSLLNFNYD